MPQAPIEPLQPTSHLPVLDTVEPLTPTEYVLEPRIAKERDNEGVLLEKHEVLVPAKTPNFGNRFKAGAEWAGNSKGRPKDAKNKVTVTRLLMESHLRDRLGVNAEDLLERAVLMAMGGSEKIMALLLDKLIASPKNTEDETPKDAQVNVNITTSLDGPKADSPSPATVRVTATTTSPPIDGEFTHVKPSP